ncbi:uncharacterized protein K02A2.6-like [Temnothorax curvispinosus]|uniref:Uncharacterized protein K02A2.6-like n=1 Tax=Temnothorax curvispinosus TaxID=300111 RepID=A0A6J1QU90_9HYME|nr:uncharacterized protein K02A2.6-like [Temnothorax curvispinosus]
MQGTDSTKTSDKLLSTFSVLGFPQELVSDNGPPFNAVEFEQFCKENAIKLTHSPPYHPQSNGMAEKAVQSIKHNLRKSLLECKTSSSLANKVNKYLLYSRNTPCVKTGVAPAELVLKQLPRTKLSMLKPEFNCTRSKETNCQMPTFRPEQSVFVKSIADKEVKWWPAKILERKSFATYLVLVNGKTRLYHASHIKVDQTVNQAKSREAQAGLPLSEACLGNTRDTEYDSNYQQNRTFPENDTHMADESVDSAKLIPQISPKHIEVPNSAFRQNVEEPKVPTSKTVINSESESPGPRRSQRVRQAPKRLNL